MNDKKELYEWLKDNVGASKDYSDELHDWIETYEYEYEIKDNKIFIKDKQQPEEPIRSYYCREYLYEWGYTIECKMISGGEHNVSLVWFPFVKESYILANKGVLAYEDLDNYIKDMCNTDNKIDIKELCWTMRYLYDQFDFLKSEYDEFLGDIYLFLEKSKKAYDSISIYYSTIDNLLYCEMKHINYEECEQLDFTCSNYDEIRAEWKKWIK